MASRLHVEICRLETFRSWKLPFIRPKELARYGFYYTGIENRVKCNFCCLENNVWEPGDDILLLHLNRSPECPLFIKRASNNVPIDIDFQDYYLDDLPFARKYGIARTIESAHTVDDDYSAVMGQLSNVALGNTTIVQSSAYPRYAAEAVRFRSFQHWPTSIHQKPQQLSDAGFFYTGSADRVVCFSCGGGLENWQKDDEPWEQHAFWYNFCKYLTLKKGLIFIEECEKKEKKIGGTPFALLSFTQTTTSEPTTSNFADDESTPPPTPTAPVVEEVSDSQDATANQSVAENKICKVCYINEYDTAFLPCGHLITCAECASLADKCTLCQQPFTSLQRIYLG
ncbi:death-associated inhibitor of apoptosis 1-like [Anopheles bellator]|uniref:death-associated inhibitor of apoptosis 1-like n=1 Tax=Anopheles bellator TaxID=139047 RepID=UPI00264787C8|nr:death-associated inhibitor of apoptosis 1-like [Anopheles bellator]